MFLIVYKRRAYICFVFFRLFLEKIITHPDHKNVPADDVAKTRQNLKVAMERAEKLKRKLLNIYTAEHDSYLQERVIILTILVFVKFMARK